MEKRKKQDDFYPLEMDCLPDFFREKAKKELNEVPEQRTEKLRKFKEMLPKDKVFDGIDFEDDLLWLYLRYRKHDASKALPFLRNFVKLQRNYSCLFQSVREDLFNTSPSVKCFSLLPKRTPDGCAIIFVEVGKWDPSEFPLEEFKKMFMCMFLQALRCPMTQINGFKIINDYQGFNAKHLKVCTPRNLYLEYHFFYQCIPARYQEIHFVNGSAMVTAVWSLFKHLMSKKMKERVFMHSKPEDLLNYFPEDILPASVGGKLTDYNDSNLMEKMNRDHGNYPIGGPANYF